MHDLATLVRMNEEAQKKAVDESNELYRRIESQLLVYDLTCVPVRQNRIVVAVDYYSSGLQKVHKGRVFLCPDSFLELE